MDDSKKNLDRMGKQIEDRLSKLEESLQGKIQKLTVKSGKGGIKDADTCYAACPICITRCCTLFTGHYGPHQCPERHTF